MTSLNETTVSKMAISEVLIAVSQKQYKRWPTLLLTTSRISHTGFQLVPVSMTLNDHNAPLAHYCNVM